LGSTLAVLEFTLLGSALSLRSFARLGASLSVLDFVHLGASLSLRAVARLGSSLSVLDYVSIGSSLALRSCTRLGAAVAVLCALRRFVVCQELGSLRGCSGRLGLRRVGSIVVLEKF